MRDFLCCILRFLTVKEIRTTIAMVTDDKVTENILYDNGFGAPIFISVCFFEVSMAEYTRNEVDQMKYHRDTYHV